MNDNKTTLISNQYVTQNTSAGAQDQFSPSVPGLNNSLPTSGFNGGGNDWSITTLSLNSISNNTITIRFAITAGSNGGAYVEQAQIICYH